MNFDCDEVREREREREREKYNGTRKVLNSNVLLFQMKDIFEAFL